MMDSLISYHYIFSFCDRFVLWADHPQGLLPDEECGAQGPGGFGDGDGQGLRGPHLQPSPQALPGPQVHRRGDVRGARRDRRPHRRPHLDRRPPRRHHQFRPRIPTVGVVYNPIMDELFTAVHGKGAFLNGSPIKTSSQDELLKALLVTEVGTKRDRSTLDDTTNRINKFLFKIRAIRMCGSLALNMCGVACGRLDMCYEIGFGGPWDVAAGALILQEAGGLVFDPNGGEFDLMSRRMAGSNGYLKDQLIKELGDTS